MMGFLAAFGLLILCGMMQCPDAKDLLSAVPRKSVVYQPEYLNVFRQQGVSNFSTLLISEESNTLYVGAKNYILALDLNNVSKEITREPWFASEDRQLECLRRGKSKAECQNYILILHKINATGLYVCGTNAFHPACRYVVIQATKLRLQMKVGESKGNCPFEPTMRYASLMVDGALYSATSNNFLGTEPIILRSLRNPLRTEFKASWLNEPTFVHMDLVQESSVGSDSDRIYVFFTETAVEFEFYDKLLVSRIAQICKGDLGGKRTLKKKWTSFLKSTLLCAVPELDFQFNVLQDVFVFKTTDWRETIFYGTFTQQWGQLDLSAVCAFKIGDVQDLFLKGNFKGPVAVESSHVKWVVHWGEVPTPRPGTCIDVSAQHQGYNSTLDLPDKVLQFARDHPLVDGAVSPVNRRPVLLTRDAKYTRLVVDRTRDLDNATYDVFFLGTDKGYLHKALNCQEEMLIMEKIQLFPSREPVQTLKLAPRKGLIYAGSPSQLVQLPVAVCSWYRHCADCVLARDPYCAWALSLHSCIVLAKQHRRAPDLIQNIRDGDASRCPKVAKKIRKYPVTLGSSPHLSCAPLSNLANSIWTFNGSRLRVEEAKYLFHAGGLVVFNMTVADTGFYECRSVEKANRREFYVTVALYLLYLEQESGLVPRKCDLSGKRCADPAILQRSSTVPPAVADPARQEQPRRFHGLLLALSLLGSAFAFFFLSLFSWNVYKGHLSLPWKAPRRSATPCPVRSVSPPPSLKPADSTQKGLATCATFAATTSKLALPVNSSGQKPNTRGRFGTSLTRGRMVCSSPNCLLTDEAQLSKESDEV